MEPKANELAGANPTQPCPAGPYTILVIDPESHTWSSVASAVDSGEAVLLRGRSAQEVQNQLQQGPVDLIVLDLHDRSDWAVHLAAELATRPCPAPLVVITEKTSTEQAVAAMRLGACDYLERPLDQSKLRESLQKAIVRGRSNRAAHEQVEKLRRICQELSLAHRQVTSQIDSLCGEMVTAYKDLASQVQRVVEAGDYTEMIRSELDLSELLRQTLSYLVEKLGPTNAAIFLPAIGDEFRVGGYVNEDFSSDVADLLLQHLADVVAPRLFDADHVLHMTDNKSLWDWIGDDAEYMADCHLIAFNASHHGEAVAAVVLFRDAQQPFPAFAPDLAATVGLKLGECIARIIRVQQRHLPELDGELG